MARKTFEDILNEGNIDLNQEYARLYILFYCDNNNQFYCKSEILYSICAEQFIDFPFRGTCISLDDFNQTHGFEYDTPPDPVSIDDLVSFSEYAYNMCIRLNITKIHDYVAQKKSVFQIQINELMEKIGYKKLESEKGLISFVPKSQPAIVVAETLPLNLSYKVIEYNHHSMKGDLARKQATLKLLADQLESQKTELKNINSQLQSDLFYLFNNLNIRHNNTDKIISITEAELETWYDKTYDLCLLAFMELENKDHKSNVLDLKKKIGDV